MKFIKEEPAGDGHTRYLFAIGKEESRVLEGLLIRALENMPRLFELQPLYQRMNNMRREIHESIFQMNDVNRELTPPTPLGEGEKARIE